MIRIRISRHFLIAALAASALLGPLPVVDADIPGLTPVETIDPSPGADVFAPQYLRLNHATHRLYVAGFSSDSTRNFGLKVIDTTAFAVTAGIDLGRYSSSYNGFYPIGLDVDESNAPAGNKVYVIGRTDGNRTILRVIDGATNTNLTGENTDVVLPVALGGVDAFKSVAVNSANHKVYVAKANGEIVVVDGPNRQVLGTLSPNFGDFLIANPAANKVFVVNHGGGGVINSADDTFTPLALFFTATAATLDATHSRLYFVGKAADNSNAVFAVDASTGGIVSSRTLAAAPLSVAVDPGKNTVYVGSATGLVALDGTSLSENGSFARPAVKLACDPTVAASLFFIEDYQVTQRPNLLYALNPTNGIVTDRALGYRPYEIAGNSRTNRVYVTDEQTNELLVIDRNPGGGISRIPVSGTASVNNGVPYLDRIERHLAVSERLDRIYLPRRLRGSNGFIESFVDVFDGATNQFVRSIALDPTFHTADHVAVDDTRRRIYVSAARTIATHTEELVLLVYDADTEAPIATIPLGRDFLSVLGGLAANPVTGRVYISAAGGVAIVDGNTNTQVGRVNAGGDIVINRRTNKIYVGGGNNMAVINGGTDSLETTFPIQNQDREYVVGFDVDEVTNRVYVCHAKEYALTGRMTAYDANNGYQLLGQIDLPVKPGRITFASASRQLFVSHDLDGVISVFQDSTPAPADLFGNISTRAHVGGGDDVLIGGFIITGSQPKTVVVRGLGPSLPVSGALADPIIEVHGSSGELLATNDNWGDATTKQEIIKSGLAPANESE
ncbi:MAG: hypothetical protein QOJ87_2098, partial [Verrucomicrobiota bacterium]